MHLLALVVATVGIWTTPAELEQRPTSGPAWENVLAYASQPAPSPNLADPTDGTNVYVLAKALVYARTGQESYRDEVIAAIAAIQETENLGRTLALGRELGAYVVAADLVGLPPAEDEAFRGWLSAVRDEVLDGDTLISTHERRPNNWGTHAGFSRMAADLYLGDAEDFARAAAVFHGWLGDHLAYSGFEFGERDWQADPLSPIGIDPTGGLVEGHNVDGVLPDDLRRSGPFVWPPPCENYVWTALQGALAQALVLDRQGLPAFDWQDSALRRALIWQYDQAHCGASGDDEWLSAIAAWAYPKAFKAIDGARPGKNMGFTDWTLLAGDPAPACPADYDDDGFVGLLDFFAMARGFGSRFGIEDFLEFGRHSWGACP